MRKKMSELDGKLKILARKIKDLKKQIKKLDKDRFEGKISEFEYQEKGHAIMNMAYLLECELEDYIQATGEMIPQDYLKKEIIELMVKGEADGNMMEALLKIIAKYQEENGIQ